MGWMIVVLADVFLAVCMHFVGWFVPPTLDDTIITTPGTPILSAAFATSKVRWLLCRPRLLRACKRE